MQSEFRPSKITLQYKLTLAHLAVVLFSIFVAEAVALTGMALIFRQSLFSNILGWGFHIVLVFLTAGIVGLVMARR